MSKDKQEKPKKICSDCDEPVYHHNAKYCREHSPWQKMKRNKYANGGNGRKTRGPKPSSGRRVKLILTIEQLALLLEKLGFPPLDIEIRQG